MGNGVAIEPVMSFEVDEEVLPFLTEAVSYIVPKAFNTGVVNAPGRKVRRAHAEKIEH